MATAIIWPWLACVATFSPASQAFGQSDAATATEKPLLDLPELVARVKPSVVTILTYDGGGKPIGQGSGFLIAKNRIVTNHHVIAGAHHAEIRLASGATIGIAGLVADDAWHDVAILQVDLSADLSRMTMRPLELANTKPQQGERIVVIGSPLGLEGTVSEGLVSTVRELSGFGTIIGITAAVSPGSSGSPVFNMRGEVIAVATFVMFDGQSINFTVGSGHLSSLKAGKIRRLTEAGRYEGDRWNEAWNNELARGIAAYLADERQKAIDHFRRVVEIDSDNELVWRTIGVCELELEHFALAIVALNQAIRLKPDLPEAHANLGLAYGRLMQWQEAIAAYKESISLEPDSADVQFGLGVVYQALARYQEALGTYKQAISIKPDYVEAHNNLGIVYERLDRYPEAIAAYQQAIRIDPRVAKAHFNLGLAYRRLGRYEEAIAAYKQAISIEPDYAEAHNNLGAAFGESGRYHEALAAYKQAVSIMPDFANAHLGLALAHMALGNRTSAIEEYKILQRLDIDLANQLFNVIWR